MSHWKQAYIDPSQTISEAIAVLDASHIQFCLVVDDNERLLGTITDGDVRRGLLRHQTLDSPVSTIMKVDPVVGNPNLGQNAMIDLMTAHVIRHLPLVNNSGQITGLVLLDELANDRKTKARKNTVVLMAGGLGSRLRPLTDNTPKPMLKVGKKPILERIVDSFIKYNFRHFLVSVNFKAEMVKAHFDDGSDWGVTIDYLNEGDKLGTAGALSLIKLRPDEPIIVMNGDVLTNVNFDNLLDFHIEQGAKATMCVRTHNFEIPFGVVTTENLHITSIDEKPVQQMLVNAGIYVLEPDVLDFIPTEQPFDMPDLFTALIKAGHETTVFPIREYWLDIGQVDDFHKANDQFHHHFSDD